MFDPFKKLADSLVPLFPGLSGNTHLADSLHFFIEDTTKIFFLLILLMLITGFFHTWISPEKLRHWLEGKPLLLAYFLAVCFGAVSPFCSCSSIPLFIAFLGSGIPLGVTMAFLIASPMINEVAVILFGEAIGWHFTFAYIATGMITGIGGGMLIDYLNLEKWLEPSFSEVKSCECKMECEQSLTLCARIEKAWMEMESVLSRVWLYILIGVGIGAVIHGFVPEDWFLKHTASDNLFAVPLAVIAAIPLYSNVTGTIPIAESLIAKGMPVGTTLAFIMSTVAISLPELMILRKVLKPQMIMFFTLYLALAFVCLGYFFNWLF
jgi:uncharacterized membrane protein YraQ (UPF0718 family)